MERGRNGAWGAFGEFWRTETLGTCRRKSSSRSAQRANGHVRLLLEKVCYSSSSNAGVIVFTVGELTRVLVCPGERQLRVWWVVRDNKTVTGNLW